MASLDEVAEMLAIASATYPNFKMAVGADAFARAWHRHVGHLTAPQLQAAMDRAVRASDFFPTVHDVLKAHAQIAAGDGQTALEAWQRVKFAMMTYGQYQPPVPGPYPLATNHRPWHFANAKTAAAVAGIGWANLFEGDEDVMRSHFVNAYNGMELREMRQALNAPATVKELT